MGFLSDVTGGFFGGPDDSGMRQQRTDNRRGQEFTQRQMGYSRDDLNYWYDRADAYRRQAEQDAINYLSGVVPQQMGYFQGGNVAAQQAILGGQPQIYQAQLPQASAFQVTLPDVSSQFGPAPNPYAQLGETGGNGFTDPTTLPQGGQYEPGSWSELAMQVSQGQPIAQQRDSLAAMLGGLKR